MRNQTQIIFPKTRSIRPIFRKETFQTEASSGERWEADGQEEFYYETSIDLRALDSMAKKAARNKSGKSHDGPIFIRIVERHRI
jgi:hypothetical protein